MTQKFKIALEEFGKKLGLDTLELNADGTLALALDDVEVAIVHLEEVNEAHFHTIIGAMPEDVSDVFHQVLMSANHMGGMTNGASIGYAAEDGVVTLNRRLPVDAITAGYLETFLEDFANLTEAWRENYAALIATAQEADVDGEPPKQAQASSEAWVRI